MEYTVVIEDPYSAKRVAEVWERHKWLTDHIGPQNYQSSKIDRVNGLQLKNSHQVFSFKSPQHAMLFKLTWGGK